jgi:hypothetical protein
VNILFSDVDGAIRETNLNEYLDQLDSFSLCTSNGEVESKSQLLGIFRLAGIEPTLLV